jgi:hypothetical protein
MCSHLVVVADGDTGEVQVVLAVVRELGAHWEAEEAYEAVTQEVRKQAETDQEKRHPNASEI